MLTTSKYKHARPRGFAPWKPTGKTSELIAKIRGVLQEYHSHLPLTVRQIFYRLVGAHGYPKDEGAYARLCEHLVRARRAGEIPFAALRDDGVTVQRPAGFESVDAFWNAVQSTAEAFRCNRLTGQAVDVEVWVEAGGMVPQIARVAHPFGIPVFSSGGFDSVTAKHDAAQRFADHGRPTVVLHVGNHDPSGESIFDSAAEDVIAFMMDLGCPSPRFVRAAVTPDQISRYGLPEAPPKAADKRGDWQGGTVQAESLRPDELAAEVRAAIESVIDVATVNRAIEAEASDRLSLVAATRRAREAIGA